MADFVEKMEYDVPELKTLTDEFRSRAEISPNGKTITIGSHKAVKKFRFPLGDGISTWHVSSPEYSGSKALAFSFNKSIGKNEQRNMIIDLLASWEAKNQLPPEVKNQALKNALLARAATL